MLVAIGFFIVAIMVAEWQFSEQIDEYFGDTPTYQVVGIGTVVVWLFTWISTPSRKTIILEEPY